jgi:hypothetical protein
MKPKLAIILLLILIPPLQAQDFNSFRTFYRDQLAKNHIPGSTVFILEDGMPVWKDFYGSANIEKQQGRIIASTNW